MKTIEIQKSANLKGNWISVIVNGKKHVMREPSLTIQVADDKPFEIKAKYNLGGSIKYEFEPKDGMLLQIFSNNQMTEKILVLIFVVMILSFAIGYFCEKRILVSIVQYIVLFLYMIFFIFIRKKAFVIKEVNKEKTE